MDYAFLRHPEPHTSNREDYAELCRLCHRRMDQKRFRPGFERKQEPGSPGARRAEGIQRQHALRMEGMLAAHAARLELSRST